MVDRKKIKRKPVKKEPSASPGPMIDEDAIAAEIGPGLFQKWSDIDNLTKEMMRHSCAYMAQELLSGPNGPPYNGRFLVSEHHAEWDELLYKHKRLCILAPRDHSKTFFFDFAYPIWQILRQPGGCGFIFSATQPQAERILSDIKAELENNPKLRWLVPTKVERWSSTHIKLTNGHQIYARGFGTKVRGAHPDWIVVDDGLNDESMYSEMVRRKQIDYFYTAISNMIIPGGQIIVVGTPFHQEDLYGDLAKNKEYVFRRYPAIDAAGNPLWADRYDQKRLDSKKKEIGGIRFAREFLCTPVADDMSLFPGHLFRGTEVEQYTVRLGMPKSWWEAMGVGESYMGVDIAMSSSAAADYMVVWVMGVDKLGNRWIQEIIREKGIGFQDQLSLIVGQARKYGVGLLYIESNQMQRVWGDELIRTTDLPIKKFLTTAEKNTLDKGVPSLRLLLENGKLRIPRGDARSVELTDIWIDEMKSFTFANGKLQSVAAHDDTVMAFWICDQAVKAGGFNFSFGDEDLGEGDTGWDKEEVDAKTKMKEILGIKEYKDKKPASGDLGVKEGPGDDSENALPFSVGFGQY